jgi:hypothetical protein
MHFGVMNWDEIQCLVKRFKAFEFL